MNINNHGYVVIGKNGCTSCTAVKNLLHKSGRQYQEVDLDKLTKEQKQDLIAKSRKLGSTTLPIILHDGEVITKLTLIVRLEG